MDELDSSSNQIESDSSLLPQGTLADYFAASDNHNYPTGGFVFTDPSTWGDALSENVSGVEKFLISSAYSGKNSFINTGVAVGNFFGADLQESNTASELADIDSDLGKYYQKNKSGADLLGFLAGSVIPGTLGVKAVNIGQKMLSVAARSGKIGGNLGKAIGLMRPAEEFASAAGKEMAATQASFSLLNANTLKAIATGYGQSVLEAAAFQTVATASMFKSPILDQADGWDITKDVILSSLEFGLVGAAFTTAKTYAVSKAIVKDVDKANTSYALTTELPKGMGPADRIVQSAIDLEVLPKVEPVSPVSTAASDIDIVAKTTRKFESTRAGTVSRLWNTMRENFRALTSGDEELGNILADTMQGLSAKQIESSLIGAEEVGRIGKPNTTEKILKKAKGLFSQSEGMGEYASESRAVQYVKLLGEDAGALLHDAPTVVNIPDLVKTVDDAKRVIAGYGFKDGQIWNPIAVPEGVNHLQAEARYYWADKVAKVKDGMKVGEHDIPVQEKILQEWRKEENASKIKSIKIVTKDRSEYEITNADDLMRGLRNSKKEVWNYLNASKSAGNNFDVDAIAKIANVRRNFLLGDSTTESRDLFARQNFAEEYNNQLVRNGVRKVTDDPVDISLKPTWVKIGTNITPIQGADGMLLSGAAYLIAKSKLVQGAVNNVVAKGFGPLFARLTDLSKQLILNANRYGAGPKGFVSANGELGSLAGWAEQTGQTVSEILKTMRASVTESLTAPLSKLSQNLEASIEYDAVKNLVHSSPFHYVPDPEGASRLMNRSQRDYINAVKSGKKAEPPDLKGSPVYIPIKNAETWDVIQQEIKINGNSVTLEKELRATQGLESNKDADTWYPNRPNPRDYKYYAMVTDNTVTGGNFGQKSMLHAATEKQLAAMMDKVNALGPRYSVRTGQDLKDYWKANGEWEYEKSLHENYIDAEMKKQGINNQFFQQTDPQKIVNDVLNHHLTRSDILVRELVNARYEPEFASLRDLGAQHTNIATSTYYASDRFAENVINNPFVNYIKTALDVKQTAEYTNWMSLNRLVDTAYSRAHYAISDTYKSLKSPTDLSGINELLTKYGIRSAYYDTATNILANHPAPKDALSKFVRGANSILSTLTLGLDPINSIVNFLGANVLLGSEIKNLSKRIMQGNSEAAGKLAALQQIAVPGVQDFIRSPSKIIAGVYKEFFGNHLPLQSRDAGIKAIDDFFISNGWVSKDISEMRAILSDLTLTGNESVKDLNGIISKSFAASKKFADWGYSKTGNKFAEYTNRWVAARTMQKFTDIAEQHGLISKQESLSYINTFVNRTQGNYLASQRPIYFQGPIGNAIGLFQTYQFNLMQQLFRYVGEGSAKDSAMLLGLQGTLFGLNGLPAFNFINTHIIGTLSSNPNHTDLYDKILGANGKGAGDWLMYGAPSNLLNTNLYSRGDINPRQVTVIPTSPDEVPIINATASFFANLKNTAQKIGAGGNIWETILQGIEHNGLSRPLAGLAQIAQETAIGKVTATSRQGTILGQNDLFTLASLSRLAGGRPIDEAIANDAAYRTTAYQAVDRERKKILDEAIRSAVIGGKVPDGEQYTTFAAKYAELGGDQKRFNQYMMKQITSANTPLAAKISNQMKSQYAQNMQEIMGGRDLMNQ